MRALVRHGLLRRGLVVHAMLSGLAAHANPVERPHVRVSLVTPQTSLRPGGPLMLGVRFELEPGWHIYWRNPGDSGEAPRLSWSLPGGLTAGEVAWPVPHALRTGPILNYGYEGDVLLPVPVTVASDLPAELVEGQDVALSVGARWLVCKEDCIPGKAELSLRLPVRFEATPDDAALAARFAALAAAAPATLAARGEIEEAASGEVQLVLRLPPPPPELGEAPGYAFFPFEPLVISHPAPQIVTRDADGVRLRLQRDGARSEPLTALAGLVVIEGNRQRRAFVVEAPLTAAATAAIGATGRAAPVPSASVPLPLVLLFAFVGGMLLNLMPCVFPVLSLKVLGVARHAHARAAARRDGWAYTAGVLVSLWVLSGLLLALRAGSARLGWGFQLQSPGFIAALAALMLGVSLNLLGAFEIGLGLTRLGALGATPGGAAKSVRQALASSFVTGALVVVVATPCTAPFMGTALGYALAQPAAIALGVFTALALGLAAPYLALGYVPALLARLPRPGAWMETLRQGLAFPMLGTVIWLLAVFAQLTDALAVWRLMAALLVGALGLWAYGRYQASTRKPALAALAAGLLCAGGIALGAQTVLGARPPAEQATAADGDWEPWSPERVAELRAQGRPVFVNFTAAWCISCKANELVVFRSEEVRRAFAAREVALLKADWTQRDARIADELARHGRAGVPLYLYYPAGDAAASPATLPSLLTPGILLAALGGGGI